MNQNHFCVRQYFYIVPGRYKGDAVSGGTGKQVMQRAGHNVRPLDWVVNQRNDDLRHRQMEYVYDDID